MTQDSSSNKSESSQLTAEGWCRSRLVIECEFDFESCNIMGNRARVFLNKQSERIHFDENTSHLVFHLRTTVPWLRSDSETPALYLARSERFLDNIRKKETFVETQPELLVPLEARSDPRTLSREIVSTETHSVPHPCTWGSNG